MGEDKALLPVNGLPLIQHIANQLKKHFGEILIGANDTEKYSFLGYPVVPDSEPGRGPLMGIMSCLMASANEICFVTGCDIPDMDILIINRMKEMATGYDLVMPFDGISKYEPLFAVYRKSVAVHAKKVLDAGSGRITDVLKYTNPTFVDIAGFKSYRNLNSRTDYNDFLEGR